jgi:hypothetical protein
MNIWFTVRSFIAFYFVILVSPFWPAFPMNGR